MFTFSQLQKNCKKDASKLPRHKLAILGNCATQHLAVAIKGYAFEQSISIDIFEADYNQISIQILNYDSEMYRFMPDSVLLYICVEELYSEWHRCPQDERGDFADKAVVSIRKYWDCIGKICNAHIIQFMFVEMDDKVFGDYAYKLSNSFIYQVKKINFLLMETCSLYKNVSLLDLCAVQAQVGGALLFDPKLYYTSKMPISLATLPVVAKRVVDILKSRMGFVKKCVVLDLDNTLWGGVIGDDGLSGIQIGELGLGRVYSALQIWFKELKNRGILLAICSKNEEAVAKEPFIKHDEMILKLEDFAVFIANWNDKVSNIKYIQQILNIGMDSIVFIDDNPFERNLVCSLIPEITIPELPEDPAEYLKYLQELNLFETASYSDEDNKRTEQYHAEAQREIMRHQYNNIDEYLQSLEMSAIVAPFDAFHAPRIAQLTQRSNQFNLRTVRYMESEIEMAINDPNKITLYFTLKDKLADHGLISVVIMEKQSNAGLFIDTWLMSCRVLNRGMEEFVINKIIETAKQHGFKTVIGEYIKTSKNYIVADIYEKLGFIRRDDEFFAADVNSFQYNKTFIKE